MKLIAHRANIYGPNSFNENKPKEIDKCIELGYDVEIDLRKRSNSKDCDFFLGHDDYTYKISLEWLSERKDHLWIHCKDLETLYKFSSIDSGYNYFFHESDDYVLTSKGYIWSYPLKPFTDISVVVLPEWNYYVDFESLKKINCYAICTDYVAKLEEI